MTITADRANPSIGRTAAARERTGTAITVRAEQSPLVLRFRRSERVLHWSIAIPFMVCWFTAMILVNVYNPDSTRPFRALFSWTHRLSGVALAVCPILALLRNAGDFRVHLNNIKQGWIWTLDDIKWLHLMGLSMIFKRIQLPEEGKFNAAEKLNFMMVTVCPPIFIATGILIWLPGAAFLGWHVHFYLALLVTPLMVGHIFMAAANPDTRVGITGMITGFVPRSWARHHYRRWYRENYGRREG